METHTELKPKQVEMEKNVSLAEESYSTVYDYEVGLTDAAFTQTQDTDDRFGGKDVSSPDGSTTEGQTRVNGSAPDHVEQTCDRWVWNPIRWRLAECVQIVISVFGITGNILVITVLAKRNSTLRSMDTLVATLAVADLFSSVFIFPIPTSKFLPNTIFGVLYCKLIDSLFFLFVGLTTSSYILMAIGIERYLAISSPFKHILIFTSRNTKILICSVWLFAGVLSNLFVPFVFVLTPECTCLHHVVPSLILSVGIYNYTVTVLIPVSSLVIVQTLTAYSLHTQRLITKKAQIQKNAKPSFHVVARNRIIKLMLVVVGIYIICFFPNQTALVLLNVGLLPISFIWSPLSSGLINLMFLNSCINPIIYTIRYPPFRDAVKDLLCGITSSSQNAPLFGQKSEQSTKGQVNGESHDV
ncbi:galanin receptor 2a-like [Lytechinus variegatus]|uniref:galanin receptor 2a-like n=1 Tax=Lytechinus variegatus TaxID=7654 RepID=UPI001BB16199|nr:galanin receptor 2a-like [Lytechinus variegatus]